MKERLEALLVGFLELELVEVEISGDVREGVGKNLVELYYEECPDIIKLKHLGMKF